MFCYQWSPIGFQRPRLFLVSYSCLVCSHTSGYHILEFNTFKFYKSWVIWWWVISEKHLCSTPIRTKMWLLLESWTVPIFWISLLIQIPGFRSRTLCFYKDQYNRSVPIVWPFCSAWVELSVYVPKCGFERERHCSCMIIYLYFQSNFWII